MFRAVALVIALVFTTPAAAQVPAVFQPGHIDLERGPDGNTVILDAPEGLIVVDTGRHPEHAQAILAYAENAGRPIAAIVNSHWHLDHTTGNQDILARFPQAEIVASDAAAGALKGFLADSKANAENALADSKTDAAARLRTTRTLNILSHPEWLVPEMPVTASGTRMIAGRRLDVRLAPAAVTEGDIWLLVPDEGLAITGDLVVAQSPFFDTGCEEGWAAALDQIAAARWTTLIPGRGQPMDRAAFSRWRTAFVHFTDCAKSAASAEDCARGWDSDAKGFYSDAEAPSVHELSLYYIDLLRSPPEQRMAYCRKG
jgi:glyoxylase-like metal-dependent hydrolase (beta-lactamase superfamily II)